MLFIKSIYGFLGIHLPWLWGYEVDNTYQCCRAFGVVSTGQYHTLVCLHRTYASGASPDSRLYSYSYGLDLEWASSWVIEDARRHESPNIWAYSNTGSAPTAWPPCFLDVTNDRRMHAMWQWWFIRVSEGQSDVLCQKLSPKEPAL